MTNEEQLMLEEKWIDSLKENKKLKDEISELKLSFSTWIQENTKLKAEIEQLKEVRNKYGLLLEMYDKKQKEIDRLKSELEKSAKEKSEVISKIEYALNECEPIYNKCAVIPQAKHVYDLAMNYCLDLLKGQV